MTHSHACAAAAARCLQFIVPVVAILLLIGGCASTPAADPDRHFAGLRDIVNSLPSGGTLDIFLVHGMGTDSDQTYTDVIMAIRDRLPIAGDGSEGPFLLVSANPPRVTLDGVPIFSPENWHTFQPTLAVARYHTKDGHHINFYELNYWRALALMKCLYIVSPDTLVEGSSSQAAYCANKPWQAKINGRLSGAPDLGNQYLKTRIMEWGLADAVIATSPYRRVLDQAVREALGIALQAALKCDGIHEDLTDRNGKTELMQLKLHDRTRFAFITESLGSYVLHDALEDPPKFAGSHIESIAPQVVICGATQVYMFANQLALLRLSELRVSSSNAARGTTGGAAIPPGGSHFFRGCLNRNMAETAVRGTEFAAQQVVAYHDPNDLLTYYTSDRPGYVGTENQGTTNVVAPFTGMIIPFVFANPFTAHTGQAGSGTIMDSVVCGHEPGNWQPCSL